MENRINIAELLRDCPKGMELDCLLYDGVIFEEIEDDIEYPIVIRTKEGETLDLTSTGCWDKKPSAKCVIFPKGKTTWEGFQRPFKDGDIVYNRLQKRICIYYYTEDEVPCINHCRYNEHYKTFEILNNVICIAKQDYRLATEEEKQRFFDIIKANGYKWNTITKTLEKIARLTFKNGDVVATSSGAWIGITTGGENGELIPTHCVIKSNGTFEAYTDVKKTWCFSRFATKEERQKLFDEIEAHGYTWNSETKTLEILIEPNFKVGDRIKIIHTNFQYDIKELNDTHYTLVAVDGGFKYIQPISEDKNWELVYSKFDIDTLKPFDKVLVRTKCHHDEWISGFFSHKDSYEFAPFWTTADKNYQQCIPYEGNEHLLGTTNDCDEFYKTWKE